MAARTETSAGGAVVQRTGLITEIAVIGRRHRTGEMRWTLPKGHVEAGETLEQAAIREVAEETGLHAQIAEPLGTVTYWFTSAGSRVRKTVHLFIMNGVGGELSADDIEVDEVAWIPITDLPDRLTYAAERELVEPLRKWVTGQPSVHSAAGAPGR